jgi:hypothetical protein
MEKVFDKYRHHFNYVNKMFRSLTKKEKFKHHNIVGSEIADFEEGYEGAF